MKRHGEDIIITKTGETEAARNAAKKLSKSNAHSWAHVWYIDSQRKVLTRETFCEGKKYNIGKCENFWFSTGKTRGITILDAMFKYGETDYIKKNALRLGATGKYSTY